MVSDSPQYPGKYSPHIKRRDKCVKNHFYSKLRKVLRKLNSIIHVYLKKEYRGYVVILQRGPPVAATRSFMPPEVPSN
jgi:hypothetical protein